MAILIKHAINNLWQNPGGDGQFNAKMFRLTPRTGTVSVLGDGHDYIKLPDRSKWYHAFTIGSVHPNWGNFDIPVKRWIKAIDVVNHYGCFLRFFVDNGHCFPLDYVWLTRKENGAIIIALPVMDIYSAFSTEDVYIRVYAGLAHNTKPLPVQALKVLYRTIRTIDERSSIMAEYERLVATNPGDVTAWVNGYLRPNFKMDDMGAWDDIEFYIDNTIVRKVVFKVSDLNSFNSELDGCRKYLLHCPKKTDDWIFSDDFEIYITSENLGYYYNDNLSNYVRQLTHADFSLPTKRVKEFFLNWNAKDRGVSKVVSVNDLNIIITIREDYLERKLTYNTDRVHDLYRLNDEQIVDAMTGVNSNVKEWQASSLELSPVNRLAHSKIDKVDLKLCTDAYGYNAIGRYLAETPQKVSFDGNFYHANLPPLLSEGCQVYEYDNKGVLLGTVKHEGPSSYYRARNNNCRLIEAIPTFASESLDVIDNMQNGELDKKLDYRFYLRKILGGIASEEYEDAEEGKHYKIENGQITWTVDRNRRHPTAVTNKNHLFYTVNVKAVDGLYIIPIVNVRDGKKLPITFKVETVELWMNGRSLVNGIDYVRKDAQAVIVTKVWTSDTGNDVVSVRVRGVNAEPREADVGFIVNGKLSDNDRFDVRDDKVVRIVAGGMLQERSAVSFGEDNSVGLTPNFDGFPYSVDSPTVPLRDIFARDDHETTFTLRDKARALDNRVEDYLTAHLAKPVLEETLSLPHYYHLFSPVISAVVADIKKKLLVPVEDSSTDRVSTKQLDEIMVRYLPLLEFDPARNGHDHRFCVVHPHNRYEVITVKELEYVLLERINHRYLNSTVQLNQYLKIGES